MRSDILKLWFRAGSCALLLAILSLSSCSDGSESGSTQLTLDSLSDAEQTELDQFVNEVRAAQEAGNHRAIRDLSDTSRMPAPLARLNNHGAIPRGPREVTAIRIEPIVVREGPLLRYEDRDYVYNVEPLGRLVVEMNDVSIGPVSVELVFGRKNGRYRLAGLEPTPITNPAAP